MQENLDIYNKNEGNEGMIIKNFIVFSQYQTPQIYFWKIKSPHSSLISTCETTLKVIKQGQLIDGESRRKYNCTNNCRGNI
jgi:hypothetical protein